MLANGTCRKDPHAVFQNAIPSVLIHCVTHLGMFVRMFLFVCVCVLMACNTCTGGHRWWLTADRPELWHLHIFRHARTTWCLGCKYTGRVEREESRTAVGLGLSLMHRQAAAMQAEMVMYLEACFGYTWKIGKHIHLWEIKAKFMPGWYHFLWKRMIPHRVNINNHSNSHCDHCIVTVRLTAGKAAVGTNSYLLFETAVACSICCRPHFTFTRTCTTNAPEECMLRGVAITHMEACS